MGSIQRATKEHGNESSWGTIYPWPQPRWLLQATTRPSVSLCLYSSIVPPAAGSRASNTTSKPRKTRLISASAARLPTHDSKMHVQRPCPGTLQYHSLHLDHSHRQAPYPSATNATKPARSRKGTHLDRTPSCPRKPSTRHSAYYERCH